MQNINKIFSLSCRNLIAFDMFYAHYGYPFSIFTLPGGHHYPKSTFLYVDKDFVAKYWFDVIKERNLIDFRHQKIRTLEHWLLGLEDEKFV